jgi:DNA-binding winged helix-turn-helix (wHTH) protein
MPGPAYQWGEWRFEPTEARLMRNGEVVPLPAKTLDVLTALLRRAPRLVTKEEIFAAVWPDAAVEEGNIAFHVAALRKVLDADGTSPIETVRGRGYRFIADVAVGQMVPTASIQQQLVDHDVRPAVAEPPPEDVSPQIAAADPAPSPAPSAGTAPRRSWTIPVIVAAVIAIAAFAVWRMQQSQPHTIALQPFEIVGPRPGEENFPDGILTYLRITLQRENIAVAPLESATAVLSGQLHPVPNGFRVDVQLSATGTGARLWEWSFDVSYDDERPPAGSGPDDERSRVQGILAHRAGQGLKSYLNLSGAAPVTR